LQHRASAREHELLVSGRAPFGDAVAESGEDRHQQRLVTIAGGFLARDRTQQPIARPRHRAHRAGVELERAQAAGVEARALGLLEAFEPFECIGRAGLEIAARAIV
jgi:hypothetical protein